MFIPNEQVTILGLSKSIFVLSVQTFLLSNEALGVYLEIGNTSSVFGNSIYSLFKVRYWKSVDEFFQRALELSLLYKA
jgi:hypothetical protein